MLEKRQLSELSFLNQFLLTLDDVMFEYIDVAHPSPGISQPHQKVYTYICIYHLEYDGICVYTLFVFSTMINDVLFTTWNTLGIFATMETKNNEPTTTLPVGNISCIDRPLVPYRTG